MPKDLIHFTIAEHTARHLSDTRYAAPLSQARGNLLLGSIFHDVSFYAITKPGRPLERLAHALHGANGQDTFTLIRLQTKHASAKGTPSSIAMLAGIVSHLYADAIMHPLVWHLTGDYYDESEKARSRTRQRHRALESLMDMVACPKKLHDKAYSIRNLLGNHESDLRSAIPLDELGETAGISARTTEHEMSRAWRLYSTLQSLYRNRPLAWTAGAIRSWLPDPAAEVAALFYTPQLMRQSPYLMGPIHYAHPVTGESHTATLADLMETAAEQSANLCRALEPAVFEGAPLLLDTIGPSMDAGLSATATTEMHHYATHPFPTLD